MSDWVAIASGALSAAIDPFGAELCSFTDSAGAQYMTDADPAFWTGRAPLLFPIVGALRDDCYRLDGAKYSLPKHGFARRSRFEIVAQAADNVRFRLADSAESRGAYPFAFLLDMEYRVSGMTLAMTATVSNPGGAPLPFSFGFHPAFAWPLPGGAAKEAHRVIFSAPEPQPVRRIDPPSGLLLPEVQPTPVRGRELVPTPALFEPDAIIWDRLNSRSLSFGAEGGSRLDIAFPDTPMLGIWQKPGAAYLCIEPWQGIADPEGYSGDLRDKPGVVSLAPGASRSFRMDVTVTAG